MAALFAVDIAALDRDAVGAFDAESDDRSRMVDGSHSAAEPMFTKINSSAAFPCRRNNLNARKFFNLHVKEIAMKLKLAVIGLSALGGAALVSGSASAMPNGLPQAGQITDQAANVDQVRWVCNPWGRCHWRPNFYGAYGYYGGPRRFYGPHRWGPRPWGYGGHWRRW